MKVAALYVDARGVYSLAPDVDIWDEARDARRYAGPHPVVAHPPCARWCQLAGLVEARYGYKRGEDGGCFAAALSSVRRFGGVLEHPAFSRAWDAYGLTPPQWAAWTLTLDGGAVAHVEQGRYGHPARKSTWLYAYGVPLNALPSLAWGRQLIGGRARVSFLSNHGAPRYKSMVSHRPGHHHHPGGPAQISKRTASATPEAFRDILLAIARASFPEPIPGLRIA